MRLFGHCFGVAALNRSLGFSDGRLDLSFERFINLVGMFNQLTLGRVDQAFSIILGFGGRTALLVFFGEGFGIAHHLINISIGKTA